MINKKTTYNCSVEEKGFSNFYEIKPNETIFQIGKLHYYLDENERINYLESKSHSIFRLEDDLEIKRVCLLNMNQYLFLRKVYKILNCKFSFTYYKNSITFRDVERNELMIINNCEKVFNGLVFYSIEVLESEGVFNDIL